MMDDLKALYQEVIIDHSRNPRNFGPLGSANRSAEGVNPLCGDELTLECFIDDNEIIQNIGFVGQGCAISVASASIMTEMLKGMSKKEAEELFYQFRIKVTGGDSAESVDIGKLEVLSGVRQFPTRVKCATLAWHTVIAAINRSQEKITTE